MVIDITSIHEAKPGIKWQSAFKQYWPAYQRWFLSEGHLARPGYTTSSSMLETHMPELMPVYEQLVELAGGSDAAARYLSLYCPPPFLTGCSQLIIPAPKARLIRNYDYSPYLFEGLILYTSWLRPVIAMSDCSWGVLDGINDAGLIVSLAFGGRKIVGKGFGIPLILRYVLETCDTVEEARSLLERVPIHMPYNVSILDRQGEYLTAYLSPVRAPVFVNEQVCTNHQAQIEWEDYARKTLTKERKAFLEKRLDKIPQKRELHRLFFKSPLYQTDYGKGFGTLYTAEYLAAKGRLKLHWPNHKSLQQSFDNFREGKNLVNLSKYTAIQQTLDR